MNIVNSLVKLKVVPYFLLVIILALHSFILTRLLFFPYPELFVYPYLTNKGLIPYKQIFDQHFPGLLFLPINLNNLGMTTPETARIWLVGIVLLTQLLIFFISKKIYLNTKLSLFACVFYLIWQPFLEGYVLWIDNFLPLFLLPAFYFLYFGLTRRKNLNLFLAGLFLGICILFKQMAIPLSAMLFLVLVFYHQPVRTLTFYLIGLIPIPLLLIIYFVMIQDFKEFFYWTVVFNLTTFVIYGKKLPSLSGLIKIIGIYSPIIFFPKLKDQKLIVILLVFIFGSLSGDFARFDFVHFQTSLPFIAILSTGLCLRTLNYKIFRWLILIYIAMTCFWLVSFYKGHLSSQIMFFDSQTYQIAFEIKKRSSTNDEIFILGPPPHLYQISDRIPAGRIFVFQFPWFLRVSQDKFLQALKSSQPKLIVRDNSVVIEGNSVTSFASDLESYINQNYIIINRIGTIEFLTKK